MTHEKSVKKAFLFLMIFLLSVSVVQFYAFAQQATDTGCAHERTVSVYLMGQRVENIHSYACHMIVKPYADLCYDCDSKIGEGEERVPESHPVPCSVCGFRG